MLQVAANSGHASDIAAQSHGQSAHANSSSSAATSSDEDSDYVTGEDETDAEWEVPDSAGAVDFEALMCNFVRRTTLATNYMEGDEGVE